ncbi:hypothetical protein MTO96_006941 [Rhipicephalus appendiculatus]
MKEREPSSLRKSKKEVRLRTRGSAPLDGREIDCAPVLPGPSTILEGRYRGTLKCDNEQRRRQKGSTNLWRCAKSLRAPHGCREVRRPESVPLLSEQADV